MDKKEKLEDIDVMEGIDFKTNQIRYREEQKKLERIKLIQLSILIIVLVLLIICLNFSFH